MDNNNNNENKWCIFSYGSNSITQLRARVENNELTALPAKCINFTRTFCYRSKNWGNGGVATICPCPDSVVFGACVYLTNVEKERLDQFEGGYRLEEINVTIHDKENVKAFAYIAGRKSDNPGYTLKMDVEPSEEYLTAIHIMLREQWDMQHETITIRSYDPTNNSVSVIKEYTHPISSILDLSLEALCVEINTRKKNPWKMPISIKKIVEKLLTVIPDDKKNSDATRSYGWQLKPYYLLLENVLDKDSYQAIRIIFDSDVNSKNNNL